ncbi:MAG: gliding motility-associated C-terminal domain-containing protein [Algoriphagus sp.]|nr:gliding motility-associated C-terminal domain-containing protein [Algoriphagus sp.]
MTSQLSLWIKWLDLLATGVQVSRVQAICLRIILISFGILWGTTVQAQESTHSAGGDGSSSTGSVAFSIGQVVYTTHSTGLGSEAQGVQQRYDLVKVKSVFELALVQTNWGMDPILPSKVNVLLSEGQAVQVGVTWDKSGMNIFARGTYTVLGTITLPNYIDNTAQVRAQIRVQVLPKPAPLDVTLNNNSFEADKNNFFIPIGAFEVTDPLDKIHVVSLNGTGYDNTYFFIKDNVLFWNSADPAAGKDSFTILIRVTDRDGNTLDKFFEITRTRPDFTALQITNAFSPTGDGSNDTWGVPDLRVFQGVRIQIFDRGGVMVFYTENPDVRWDGTHNGKELPAGSYFWTIEVIETGEMRRGVLNLIKK